DALVAFAERTGIPVMTAFRRHDAFPNQHPLYLGSLSIGAPPAVIERARNADVVLAIGTRLGETTTFAYTIPGDDATLIHVDVSPEVVGRTFPATIGSAADATRTLQCFLREAGSVIWPDRTGENRTDRDVFERATAVP